MEMLESVKEGLDEVVYRRAMHVISENTRVEGAEVALKAGEFEELGKLMVASHNSLRDDFEVRRRRGRRSERERAGGHIVTTVAAAAT